MRIFSFIPAFLLVIVSFVAAAAITPTTAAVTSCAAESGNAAVLQCLTGAVKNANEQLQPLKDKLAGMFVAVVFSYLTDHHPASGNSGTPDADIVNQIGTVLSTVTAQLQGVQPADFADLDVGDLITALLDVSAFMKL